MTIDYRTYKLSRKELIQYIFYSNIIICIVIYVFYQSIIFSILISPILAILFKKKYIKYLIKKRKELFINQFMDLLQSMSASFSTGRQMSDALEEGLYYLKNSYNEKSPLVWELTNIIDSIKYSRAAEEILLKDLAKRLNLKEFINFVEIYSICKEIGGDMEKAILKTVEITLDKLSLEREMKLASAQKKFESKIISAMPIIVIIFLKISNQDYIEPLFTTIGGKIIMTISLVGIITAHYITERLTELKL